MSPDDTAGFGPPRWPGDTRPPFQPGNRLGQKFAAGHEVTTTHGAWSKRKVDPLADELVAWVTVLATMPDTQVAYLADPGYSMAVRRWARLEARVELLRTWLDDRTDSVTGWPGDLDEAGEVRPAADLLVKLEGQAAKAGERLGLDPLSRSKLGRDVAATQVDLASVAAAGQAALAGRAVDLNVAEASGVAAALDGTLFDADADGQADDGDPS